MNFGPVAWVKVFGGCLSGDDVFQQFQAQQRERDEKEQRALARECPLALGRGMRFFFDNFNIKVKEAQVEWTAWKKARGHRWLEQRLSVVGTTVIVGWNSGYRWLEQRSPVVGTAVIGGWNSGYRWLEQQLSVVGTVVRKPVLPMLKNRLHILHPVQHQGTLIIWP